MQSLGNLIQSKPLRDVFDYWESMKSGDRMPLRSEFDPSRIKESLPYVWMYKRGEDGEFYCSLAGEEVQSAWGHGIIGLKASDILTDSYATVIARWEFVLARPAVAYTTLADAKIVNSKPVYRLTLPLADDDGVPYIVFGVSHYYYPSEDARDIPIRANPSMEYFDAVDYRDVSDIAPV